MHQSGYAPTGPQELEGKRDVYTKLPRGQIWQQGTALIGSGTEADIPLKGGDTVRMYDDFIRPCTSAATYPEEEGVVTEELDKSQKEEIDQPNGIRQPQRTPKPK